ncbi:MAG: 16S rRNA (uracil(1498)-N(3))-methyltransferase [Cellvibrionaceae bacterium]|nr:16S rRNA (uracil(1498)-N(3))-methyltransferase [Cellvibrionaceae bacterium]
MNLVLLQPADLVPGSPDMARLKDRRHQHIVQVHKLGPGASLKVGMVNGQMGRGEIVGQDNDSTSIALSLDTPAPPPSNIELILALPRPLMLKRVLQTVASLGIKQIHLIHTAKVEKSYWQSPQLHAAELEQQLILGLEQGVDTTMPQIHSHRRFKPFAEDVLPGLLANKAGFVAHPSANADSPQASSSPCCLAIGPEGGFNDYEVERLQGAGMQALSLGPRILRVETAVPVLIAKLAVF